MMMMMMMTRVVMVMVIADVKHHYVYEHQLGDIDS